MESLVTVITLAPGNLIFTSSPFAPVCLLNSHVHTLSAASRLQSDASRYLRMNSISAQERPAGELCPARALHASSCGKNAGLIAAISGPGAVSPAAAATIWSQPSSLPWYLLYLAFAKAVIRWIAASLPLARLMALATYQKPVLSSGFISKDARPSW